MERTGECESRIKGHREWSGPSEWARGVVVFSSSERRHLWKQRVKVQELGDKIGTIDNVHVSLLQPAQKGDAPAERDLTRWAGNSADGRRAA